MYLGTFRHSVDGKGRLIIPSKYREMIGTEALYITNAFSDNLSVYPESAFRKHTASLTEISSTDADMMDIKNYILSSTQEVSLDPQGRILLPQEMREEAGIKREAVIIGSDDYFVIWDAARWEEERAAKFKSKKEMREKAKSLGIRF
ncbi:MAG: division/cell wall cluster transcriptional repressor MraZ [Lachnospiraceae bacterium]|nr:division/cell wall cluster transcriptional repressor MraZ [Lachnospiraceae bacterium]